MPERGLNIVHLIGRVGQDPEIRSTQSGDAVGSFSLATNEVWTKDGETRQSTEWHRIEVWRGLAETVGKYVKSGSRLYISGSIRTDEWEDSEGNTRRTTKIRANQMVMLGDKGDRKDAGSNARQTDAPF